jgi:hypothetical protein
MVDLNLKDAPIRRRIALDDLCRTPFDPADPSIEKIHKALTRQSELGAMEALVLPLALGKDVDHLTVREAALPFTRQLPSAFYEDLPYAATDPGAAAELEALSTTTTTAIDGPLSPVTYPPNSTTEEAAARKRQLVLNYASQIDDEAGRVIADFVTRYNGAERLWANQSWVKEF